MKKQISPKSASLIFSILVVCFAIAFYTFAAWQEPTSPQPGGNVPPPLNTGSVSQYKSGGLGIGGLFVTYGETYLAADSGNVGIGTTGPGEKLVVDGNIKVDQWDTWIGATEAQSWKFGTNKIYTTTTGNIGIGMTEPSKELDVSGEIHATGDICTDQGGGVCLSAGGGGFGVWNDRNKDGVADSIAFDTNYYAETDGLAVAYVWTTWGWPELRGYTDGKLEPNTLIAAACPTASGGPGSSITIPVRKGDHWRIDCVGWAGGDRGIKWLPIGN